MYIVICACICLHMLCVYIERDKLLETLFPSLISADGARVSGPAHIGDAGPLEACDLAALLHPLKLTGSKVTNDMGFPYEESCLWCWPNAFQLGTCTLRVMNREAERATALRLEPKTGPSAPQGYVRQYGPCSKVLMLDVLGGSRYHVTSLKVSSSVVLGVETKPLGNQRN